MSDAFLRKKLIRLAHANPELRPHLLPLLQKVALQKLPPKYLPIFTELVQDAIDEVKKDYEGFNTHLMEPGGPGSMFGGGTDGGLGAETYTTLSSMSGSGRWPRNPKLAVLQKAESRIYAAAAEWWRKENADFLEENGLSDLEVSYNDLDELGFQLEAESLSEAEQSFFEEEDITFRIGAFYHMPRTPRPGQTGDDGKVEVFALVDCDGRYLPNSAIHTFETSFTFTGEKDLRQQLAVALKAAAASLA